MRSLRSNRNFTRPGRATSVSSMFPLHTTSLGVSARFYPYAAYGHSNVHHSRFTAGPKPQKLQDAVLEWNSALSGAAAKFAAEHTDATVLVWSSWRLFSDILVNPAAYGFSQEDAAEEEGAIFEDGLHPTSAVHRVIAQELLEFLSTLTRQEEV